MNPWAPFDLRRELPKGGYSNNPLNDFNILVNTIVASGIDVVFCAGNCGEFLPGRAVRPQRYRTRAQYPRRCLPPAGVVCRGGAGRRDVDRLSSQGPDSRAFRATSPTSAHHAASPRITMSSPRAMVRRRPRARRGRGRALRTKWPPERVSRTRSGAFLSMTAQRPAATVWDRQHGFGVLDWPPPTRHLRPNTPEPNPTNQWSRERLC